MTKTTFFAVVVLLASTLVISCNNTEKTETKVEASKTAFDLTTAKKEIEQINQDFATMVTKGDSIGIANLYTADAKLMFAGAPAAVGRANIQTAFDGVLKSGVTKIDLKTNEVFGTEDLLAEDGEVTIYVKDMVVANEKYIVLWKKEDGKWKLFRDISNSNAPMPASK